MHGNHYLLIPYGPRRMDDPMTIIDDVFCNMFALPDDRKSRQAEPQKHEPTAITIPTTNEATVNNRRPTTNDQPTASTVN